MPQNMELDIEVTLSGQENPNGSWSIDAVYNVTRSLPLSQNVVTASGGIDLGRMAKTAEYSNSTVMKFSINSNVIDKNGNPAMTIFPTPRSDAVQFVAIHDPSRAIAPPESEFTVSPSNDDPWTLIFTDIDNSVGSYEYCLRVKCWNKDDMSNTTMVQLDPPITNRAADN